MKVDYSYPSFEEWERVMELTEAQVRAFLPESKGSFLNKGVKVLDDGSWMYDEWKRGGEGERSLFQKPPLVKGIVAIYCHDCCFYLIRVRP